MIRRRRQAHGMHRPLTHRRDSALSPDHGSTLRGDTGLPPLQRHHRAAFFYTNHKQRKFQTSVKNLPLCPEGRALEYGEDYCYVANKLLSLRGRTLPGLKTEVWTRYTRPHKLGPPFSIARKSPARRRTAHPTRVYPSIQIGLSTSRQPTGHGLTEATL